MPRRNGNGAAAQIALRLRARREEIETATLVRIGSVSGRSTTGDLTYSEGLHAAIEAGIAFGVVGVEQGDQAVGPIPTALLGQTRLAAAMGTGLDIVLRCFLAAHAVLADFLVDESEHIDNMSPSELKALLRRLTAAVDRLLAGATEAYHACEEEARPRRGTDGRRTELIERTLVGEPVDARELGYDLDGHQLGLLASGAGATDEVRGLARRFDASLLLAEREDGALWAWLGRRRAFDVDAVWRYISTRWSPDLPLALGEVGEGLSGWRLTHHQARAAFTVARRGQKAIVRYLDVAMLAAILRDDLLAVSLRQLFLEPLEDGRDGGAELRTTLRAYIVAGRNGASAAKALGVSRQTVNNRLQRAEDRIGRPLLVSSLELDAALRLAELTDVKVHSRVP